MSKLWFPMDKAPKDGTWIMLAISDGQMVRAHWAERNNMYGWHTRWCMWLGEPLEWRSLLPGEKTRLKDWKESQDPTDT
jgi:hypothetical protein